MPSRVVGASGDQRSATLALVAALLLPFKVAHGQTGPIVHDGEYYFLHAEKGEEWERQDARVDQRLAQIRQANGGKRPNILYVLIDDVSFGLMGNRANNFVTGIDTSNINFPECSAALDEFVAFLDDHSAGRHSFP